jgi:hypothetical protein
VLSPIWADLRGYLDRYYYMSNSDEDVAAVRFVEDAYLPFAILFNIVQSTPPPASTSAPPASSSSSDKTSEVKDGSTSQKIAAHTHELVYAPSVVDRMCDFCSSQSVIYQLLLAAPTVL